MDEITKPKVAVYIVIIVAVVIMLASVVIVDKYLGNTESTSSATYDKIEGLRNATISSVYDIFLPRDEKVMQRGLDRLRPFMTQECFDQMEGATVFDKDSREYTITDFRIGVCSINNSSDNTEKVSTVFSIVKKNDASKYNIVMLELSMNNEGKVFKYELWRK